MLKKKIMSLLLTASILTPAAVAVEGFDSECVEAATNFISVNQVSPRVKPLVGAYGLYIDVNGDNKFDLSDYTLLKRYLDSDGEGIKINESRSDANFDGSIDFLDLLTIKNLL